LQKIGALTSKTGGQQYATAYGKAVTGLQPLCVAQSLFSNEHRLANLLDTIKINTKYNL